MDTGRAEQIYNIYYYNQADPFGIHSRSFYKIRDRFLKRAFSGYFSGAKKRLLDIASGPGNLMKGFHECYPMLEITCSDMNPVALGYLKDNTGFRVLELKLPGLEGLNEQFDIISCFDTLYLLNVEDMQVAMNRVHQLMNDEGAIFMVDFDLSKQMDPEQFTEIAHYTFATDRISKTLFFSVEQKMRDKFNVLHGPSREQLIRFGVLPQGFTPRHTCFFWILYYLLYPARMINKVLYSSVLLNRFFSIFGKEYYTFFVYRKSGGIKKPIV